MEIPFDANGQVPVDPSNVLTHAMDVANVQRMENVDNAERLRIYNDALANAKANNPVRAAIGLPVSWPIPPVRLHYTWTGDGPVKVVEGPDTLAPSYLPPVPPPPPPPNVPDFFAPMGDDSGNWMVGVKDTMAPGTKVTGPDGHSYIKIVRHTPFGASQWYMLVVG